MREAEATAAEARAARESADEERQRVNRELGSAQALVSYACIRPFHEKGGRLVPYNVSLGPFLVETP